MHATGLKIRHATLEDRDFVLQTARRLAEFEPPPNRTREQIVAADAGKLAAYFRPGRLRRRRLTRALGRVHKTELLVAEQGARPLGFVYLCKARDYFSGRDEAYVDVIAVSAEAAGRGVGSALLEAADAWARARGFQAIALNVFAANRHARAVYEHFGYAIETTRYVKTLSGTDVSLDSRKPAASPAAALPTGRREEWFDDDAFWRELYDCIFTPERLAEAASEVEGVLSLVQPRGRDVLDLACGPGRCAIELARRGFRVTGVDRSSFLLARARERAAEAGVQVQWQCADMREFFRPGAFDLVLNMFTSFGYFACRDEDLLVLRNARDSLRPGGTLVIDVVGKECVARLYRPETTEQLPGGVRLTKRHQVRDDWTRLHEEWVVQRGSETRSFRYQHTLYSGQELRERIERAGFEGVRLYGGFAGEPYGPDAACLLAVGRKPVP